MWLAIKKIEAFFSQIRTRNDKSYQVLTTALQCIKTRKPYILAGFKPEIFCSAGGGDDHYATPPGLLVGHFMVDILSLLQNRHHHAALYIRTFFAGSRSGL
jgi:hypothetical protein